MKRREFLQMTTLAGAATLLPRRAVADTTQSRIAFSTTDSTQQMIYQSALALLQQNTQTMPGYKEPVLIEGSVYRGVWLECAPQEGLVYAPIDAITARNNHMAFFSLQREDGQLPCNVKTTAIGHGQIQMVVPIAATAFELAEATGDDEFLQTAYIASSRWDAWLSRYRNTRGTGLCEGFCTYDTGQDNSPRWAGMPNACPDGDARKCPPIPSLPRLCPDLSATVYGGRIALAAMANALGKKTEAEKWLTNAATIREAILNKLYFADEAAFYDVDAHNNPVRVRGDVLSRVFGEHVVDPALFETLYLRQMHNPKAFWAPFPLPSIAIDDPTFVRPIPLNSWGGASQALTALRAPRWMEHYGKSADLAHLMQQWIKAITKSPDFRQQIDPISGEFSADPPGYSPAALVFFDFTWRLAGVRSVGDNIEWNIRPQDEDVRTSFRLRVTPMLTAELLYERGEAKLLLNNKPLLSTRNTVRITTNREGTLLTATGIAEQTSSVLLHQAGSPERKFTLAANQQLTLR